MPILRMLLFFEEGQKMREYELAVVRPESSLTSVFDLEGVPGVGLTASDELLIDESSSIVSDGDALVGDVGSFSVGGEGALSNGVSTVSSVGEGFNALILSDLINEAGPVSSPNFQETASTISLGDVSPTLGAQNEDSSNVNNFADIDLDQFLAFPSFLGSL